MDRVNVYIRQTKESTINATAIQSFSVCVRTEPSDALPAFTRGSSCVYAGVFRRIRGLFLRVQLHSCVYAADLRSGLISASVTMFLRLCDRSPFWAAFYVCNYYSYVYAAGLRLAHFCVCSCVPEL